MISCVSVWFFADKALRTSADGLCMVLQEGRKGINNGVTRYGKAHKFFCLYVFCPNRADDPTLLPRKGRKTAASTSAAGFTHKIMFTFSQRSRAYPKGTRHRECHAAGTRRSASKLKRALPALARDAGRRADTFIICIIRERWIVAEGTGRGDIGATARARYRTGRLPALRHRRAAHKVSMFVSRVRSGVVFKIMEQSNGGMAITRKTRLPRGKRPSEIYANADT